MEALLILVIVAALLALGYAAFNFIGVKKLDEGTDRMKEIAAAIRVGANAFITYEYKIIAVVVVIIAIAFAAIFTVQYGEFSWEPSVCFMIGVIMSASAGWVGMKIATYANVRVSNTARNTKNIGSTLKVALKGGSVMGLCVGGFALLGLFLVYIIFGFGLNMLDIEALRGAHVFTQCLSCYALGCSIVAMFNRVGGGIYTKAADMGADLVGKTEAHIPEDDPRNPATIADNVGDNVGGQQQRVMIARAMIGDPKLLILDEPTTGVDARSTKILYDMLYEINTKYNTTIFMITHGRLQECKGCDRILRMDEGRIVEE